MTTTYAYSTTLTVTSCSSCCMGFAIPDNLYKDCRATGRTFYCPNGHRLSWHETDADRLKAQVARLEERTQWQADQLGAARRDATAQRRSLAATKGHLTRTKNRIANGVCPVPGCKRSGLGADVVAHIATCHPDFHTREATS